LCRIENAITLSEIEEKVFEKKKSPGISYFILWLPKDFGETSKKKGRKCQLKTASLSKRRIKFAPS